MKLADLDTPSLVLDKQRLQANIARIGARAKALGVDLRAPMKTAQCAGRAEAAH